MRISPVTENQADKEIKEIYTQLAQALSLHSVPLFFTYIGSFPDYFKYISDQLLPNLHNTSFNTLAQDLYQQTSTYVHDILPYSTTTTDWMNRYKETPSFYYFQNDLEVVHLANVKLALIFIALRETVKGWAVAAKQIQTTNDPRQTYASIHPDQFVFELTLTAQNTLESKEIDKNSSATDQSIDTPPRSLVRIPSSEIEINLLQNYLVLCRNDFHFYMKHTEFWELRLTLEKLFLHSIQLFPQLIFSPINVVYELTSKYPDFYDLLYLLSEQFPTLAMQRMMFSGYMKQI